MDYPFESEIKDLARLWRNARTEAETRKEILSSEGKSPVQVRRDKKYRLLRKKVRVLSVKRSQINKKRSRLIEKGRRTDGF